MLSVAIVLMTTTALAAPDRGEADYTVESTSVELLAWLAPRTARERYASEAASPDASSSAAKVAARSWRDVRHRRGKAGVARPEHARPADRQNTPAPSSAGHDPGRAGGPPPTGR